MRDALESLRESAGRVRQDIRPRRRGRNLAIAAFGGMLLLVGFALAAPLAHPRRRRGIVRVAGETRQRATSSVHDARERFGSRTSGEERRAA